MSDQNTPPPFDENSQAQAAPPPIADTPPPVGPAPASPSVTVAGLMEAPSTAGIALGMGKLHESDEKTMAMLAHLLGGITCLLGPLIIWIIKKDESVFVNDQGKEAVNFQLSILLGYVVTGILSFIPIINCFSWLFFPVFGIAGLIFGILACLEANKGVVYRYPYALRFIK
jgi:uncharacterized Tic20 family protein